MTSESNSIIIIEYMTGLMNGAPKLDWLCPYCKSHNELKSTDYENKIYCDNCWCWFEFNQDISQLYGEKYDIYTTGKNIDNAINLGIIKKISKELKEKNMETLIEVEKKFYSPFGIDGLYEYHTIITKKEKDDEYEEDDEK